MKNLYNKISELLCSFSPDKYVHYIVMLIFTFLFAKLMTFAFTYIGCNYPTLFAIALTAIIGLVIGIGKEKWDLKREGVFDYNDIKADILGIITGCLMSII